MCSCSCLLLYPIGLYIHFLPVLYCSCYHTVCSGIMIPLTFIFCSGCFGSFGCLLVICSSICKIFTKETWEVGQDPNARCLLTSCWRLVMKWSAGSLEEGEEEHCSPLVPIWCRHGDCRVWGALAESASSMLYCAMALPTKKVKTGKSTDLEGNIFCGPMICIGKYMILFLTE